MAAKLFATLDDVALVELTLEHWSMQLNVNGDQKKKLKKKMLMAQTKVTRTEACCHSRSLVMKAHDQQR